jgi:hypothetical protein
VREITVRRRAAEELRAERSPNRGPTVARFVAKESSLGAFEPGGADWAAALDGLSVSKQGDAIGVNGFDPVPAFRRR